MMPWLQTKATPGAYSFRFEPCTIGENKEACEWKIGEDGAVFRGDFGLFYQMVGNNALLLPKTDILDLYVYRALASTSDMGMASAAGFYQSVLCFITIMTVNGIIRKANPDYALF